MMPVPMDIIGDSIECPEDASFLAKETNGPNALPFILNRL
jgi:hypothetical protein